MDHPAIGGISSQRCPSPAPRPLRREIEARIPERPFAVEFWDGTRLPPTDGAGPTFFVRSPRAAAHALRAPGQLGLGRAYVSGDDRGRRHGRGDRAARQLAAAGAGGRRQGRLLLGAVRAAGIQRPPRRPAAELVPSGRRHSKERDAKAVRHHYDVSNEFFALFLDDSMTYSCAFFAEGAETLEQAQEEKLDTVARKLALDEGDRVLDVGCGWGAFPLRAATKYGAQRGRHHPLAAAGRAGAAAGRGGRGRRPGRGPRDGLPRPAASGERFDAIASIGMVEHVGEEQIDVYARTLAGLLEPGGRLLNHGIARLRHTDPEAGAFSERYVFPDGEPLHLSRVLLALERAGFVTRHVSEHGADYAETLRHWARRLDENLDEAVRLAGPERVRVWRLYLRAARNGFENGFLSIYQARCSLA